MDELQGADRFAAELRTLGYAPQRDGDHGVWFSYVIENGPRRSERTDLGFVVPANFPIEPPHGPNYRPTILRASGLPGVHPGHELGPEWDHWSRPHPAWAASEQTVRAFLRHIRRLNEELPAPEDDQQADAA